ncbi:MAG: Ig-like domain-containing protein [Gemmatimonadota bacterium]|nr:Ig-like domain-containing protein [Gemmatimonadota bacterium]
MRFPYPVVLSALVVACSGGGDSTAPGDTAGVASVSLNVTSAQLGVGQTLQLSATPLTSTGTVTSGTASWSSSAPAVATVSSTGLVSAVAAGVSTISAAVGGRTGTATVTVSAAGGAYPLAAEVTMPGNTFSPFLTTIGVGGTVTFRFGSVDHNVLFAAITGRPADIQITRNVNVARTFNARGLFPYDCSVHPGMSGQVEVK